MSKFNIKIETNDNNTHFKQGDTINGKVHVSILEEVKCNSLFVYNRWYTHGMGNRSSRIFSKQELFKGQWNPGEYSYDFSLKIDNNLPPTYHGHYINIDHAIKAQADIPWKVDPRANCDILLERSNDSKSAIKQNKAIQLNSNPSAFGLILILFLIISGPVIIYYSFKDEIMISLLGIGIISFGVYLLLNRITAKKIGDIAISLSKSVFHPGDNAKLYMKIKPPKDLKVNSIKACIEMEETAISGSGTKRTTHTHTTAIKQLTIENTRTLRSKIPYMSDTEITIPNDATATFDSYDNKIKWFVSVTIDIDTWPDWSTRKEIKVL